MVGSDPRSSRREGLASQDSAHPTGTNYFVGDLPVLQAPTQEGDFN